MKLRKIAHITGWAGIIFGYNPFIVRLACFLLLYSLIDAIHITGTEKTDFVWF